MGVREDAHRCHSLPCRHHSLRPGLELLPAPPPTPGKEAPRLAGPPLLPGNLAVYFCLWAPCFHRASPGRLAAAGLEGWSSCCPAPAPPARPGSTSESGVTGDEGGRSRPGGQDAKGGIPTPNPEPRWSPRVSQSIPRSSQRVLMEPLVCPALFILYRSGS